MKILFILWLLLLPIALSATPNVWKYEWGRTDFTKTSVYFDDIIDGGPPKDGIPAIDNPEFQVIGDVKNISDNEAVMVVTHGDIAKAYPIRILLWHEIVNDMIGDLPITVTYCPLCNSAIVFDRRVAGKILDFGVTGKLRHSDMIMYDRQTESWWQQFLGKAIIGTMNGRQLNMLPSNMVPFGHFKKYYPDGLVLKQPDYRRPYGNNPYLGYDSMAQPLLLYQGDFDRPNISPMQYVVVIGDKAISMALIKQNKGYRDGKHVIRYRDGMASPLDTKQIAFGRDIGFIEVLERQSDATLKPIIFDRSFAFVFDAFYPNQPIITK